MRSTAVASRQCAYKPGIFILPEGMSDKVAAHVPVPAFPGDVVSLDDVVSVNTVHKGNFRTCGLFTRDKVTPIQRTWAKSSKITPRVSDMFAQISSEVGIKVH